MKSIRAHLISWIRPHILVIFAVAALACPLAHAAEGNLDPTFAKGLTYGPGKMAIAPPLISGSTDDTAYAVAIQRDGKILVAGRAGGTGISGTLAVVRLWQDGTLDTSFGNTGRGAYVMPLGSSMGRAIAIASNGDIIIGGSLGNQALVVALRPDGLLDTTFGGTSPGVTLFGANGDTTNTTGISDLKLNTSDAIYVTGNYNGSGHQQMMLSLLTPGGTVLKADASEIAVLGGWGDQYAAALAIQPDGKLLIAGYAFQGGINAFGALLARHDVTLDGSGWHFPLDSSFSSSGISFYYDGSTPRRSFFNDAIALMSNGNAIAGGRIFDPATSSYTSALAYRLDAEGQISSVFESPVTPFGDNSIRKALPDTHGNIVFTGFSGWDDGQGDSGSGYFAMRTNATNVNTPDASFGNAGIRFFTFDNRNTNDQSFGAALDRYGRVVIVGNTQYGVTNPDFPVMGVARLTSDLIFENGVELHE